MALGIDEAVRLEGPLEDHIRAPRTDDPTDRDFAGWLRSRMQARRMSQRRLAARSGVDHSTISRLLRGRPVSLATATKLVRAIGTGGDAIAPPPYLVQARPTDDPISRLQEAVRFDGVLCEADVRVLVDHYVALRARRTGSETLLRRADTGRAP